VHFYRAEHTRPIRLEIDRCIANYKAKVTEQWIGFQTTLFEVDLRRELHLHWAYNSSADSWFIGSTVQNLNYMPSLCDAYLLFVGNTDDVNLFAH